MAVSTGPFLLRFVHKNHLWPVVLMLCVLGIHDVLSIGVWSWYQFLTEVDEVSCSYRIHRLENRRRYEQFAKQDSNSR